MQVCTVASKVKHRDSGTHYSAIQIQGLFNDFQLLYNCQEPLE